MKGDEVVNLCLDSRLEREKDWTVKKSAIVQSENMYDQVSQLNDSIKACQNNAKRALKDQLSSFWHDQVKNLLVQGRF
jgi:hypothetical protein